MVETHESGDYFPSFSFGHNPGLVYVRQMFHSESARAKGTEFTEAEMQDIIERNSPRLNNPANYIDLTKVFTLGDK